MRPDSATLARWRAIVEDAATECAQLATLIAGEDAMADSEEELHALAREIDQAYLAALREETA